MFAWIRRLPSIFKTSWVEIRKEPWTRQESKNEMVHVHKGPACTLRCPGQEALAAAHGQTRHADINHRGCAHLPPTRHPAFVPAFLRSSEPRYSSEAGGFNTQVKFMRHWKGVANRLRKRPWLNTTLSPTPFSGNLGFSGLCVSPYSTTDACASTSRWWHTGGNKMLEVGDGASIAGLGWPRVYVELTAFFFSFLLMEVFRRAASRTV